MMASKKAAPLAAASPRRKARAPEQSEPVTKEAPERNTAPSQWGRRMARLVGEKFGVAMSDNWSKNVGTYQGKEIVIKCAKSPMPPVSVLIDMVDRIDQLWAVYIMLDGHAEVWIADMDKVRQAGYFTRGPNVQKRVEISLRKIVRIGTLLGTLSEEEVDSCQIP